MKKFNIIILFLGLFFAFRGEVAYGEDSTVSIALSSIEIEKSTPTQGVTLQSSDATDKVVFHFDLKRWGNGTLRVSDARGEILIEKEIKDWTIGIDLHEAAPGLYSITLEKNHLLEIVEIIKK